jgi:hypothetical protein
MWDEYPEAFEELEYAPDPNDGLFWMEFKDATNYYWRFFVCMAETQGKREPTPISQATRLVRSWQDTLTMWDRVVLALKAELFDPLDANGDGVLDLDELRVMKEKLKMKLPEVLTEYQNGGSWGWGWGAWVAGGCRV